MSARPTLLRPRDTDALRAELRRVAFGGEVHGDTLLLAEFPGIRTGRLRCCTAPTGPARR